ncbi:MAG: sigma-70 family RNA polymerase sigma factor [Clostridia bacterium]|nr:sigma-70 family RNA polymerase sigma factor [Clostridia bacterium]
METITYKFADGTTRVVEVSDEIYALCEEMEIEEKSSDRRETRRHVSMESLVEMNLEPTVIDEYFKEDIFGNMENEDLQQAISQLLPTQKDLIRRVFYEGYSVTEIAKNDGIAVCSVSKKLERIYKKLKKFL